MATETDDCISLPTDRFPLAHHRLAASHVRTQGFAVVGPVLEANTITSGRRLLDQIGGREDLRADGILTTEPATSGSVPRKVNDIARVEPFFRAIIDEPPIRRVVSAILGPDVKLHTSIAWLKQAGVGSAKDAHQDLATWKHLVLPQVVTLWIAFDDATVENGCMHFLRNSHRDGGLRPHTYGTSFSIPGFKPPTTATVACPVPAGFGTLHDGMTVHWTPPNTTSKPRRAVSYSFVNARTRVATPFPELVNSFPSVIGREFPGCV